MAKDKNRKQLLLNVENQIKRRFQEMEETLIKIQQEHAATKSHLWRLQPTDWNARNTTPIRVAAFFTPQIFEEEYEEHQQQSQQAITCNNTITTYFNWKPSHLFYTQCVIKDTVCSLVIYGGNNIVSKRLVEKLKLRAAKKDPSVTVMSLRGEDLVAEETCRVPVSFGEYYKDKVTCYVVNMEEEEDNQLLFGGPWLNHVCARHDAQDNTCTITWNSNRIVLSPELQD